MRCPPARTLPSPLPSLHLTPATAMSRTLLCTAPWRGPARARAIPSRHSRCSPPQRHTPLATCTTTACPGQSSRLGVPAGRWHRTPQLPGALFLLCYSLVPHATVQQQAFHTHKLCSRNRPPISQNQTPDVTAWDFGRRSILFISRYCSVVAVGPFRKSSG